MSILNPGYDGQQSLEFQITEEGGRWWLILLATDLEAENKQQYLLDKYSFLKFQDLYTALGEVLPQIQLPPMDELLVAYYLE